MKDWVDTLSARQSGYMEGFLSADIPLEKQDTDLGGPLATPADDEDQADTGRPTDQAVAAAEAERVSGDFETTDKKPTRSR